MISKENISIIQWTKLQLKRGENDFLIFHVLVTDTTETGSTGTGEVL